MPNKLVLHHFTSTEYAYNLDWQTYFAKVSIAREVGERGYGWFNY